MGDARDTAKKKKADEKKKRHEAGRKPRREGRGQGDAEVRQEVTIPASNHTSRARARDDLTRVASPGSGSFRPGRTVRRRAKASRVWLGSVARQERGLGRLEAARRQGHGERVGRDGVLLVGELRRPGRRPIARARIGPRRARPRPSTGASARRAPAGRSASARTGTDTPRRRGRGRGSTGPPARRFPRPARRSVPSGPASPGRRRARMFARAGHLIVGDGVLRPGQDDRQSRREHRPARSIPRARPGPGRGSPGRSARGIRRAVRTASSGTSADVVPVGTARSIHQPGRRRTGVRPRPRRPRRGSPADVAPEGRGPSMATVPDRDDDRPAVPRRRAP